MLYSKYNGRPPREWGPPAFQLVINGEIKRDTLCAREFYARHARINRSCDEGEILVGQQPQFEVSVGFPIKRTCDVGSNKE